MHLREAVSKMAVAVSLLGAQVMPPCRSQTVIVVVMAVMVH